MLDPYLTIYLVSTKINPSPPGVIPVRPQVTQRFLAKCP